MEGRSRLAEEDENQSDNPAIFIPECYNIPECYKQDWKGRLCRSITSKDDILSLTRSTQYRLYFHISGFVDSETGSAGYGAILRDIHGNPLTARCGVLSQSEMRKCAATPFYTELKGVSTALKMALDYQVKEIWILPTNNSVGRFVNNFVTPAARNIPPNDCFPWKDHVLMQLHRVDRDDIDQIYRLTINMVTCLLYIKRRGLEFFFVNALTYKRENKAAQWLVKRRKNKDMMPSDLFRYEELADMLLNNKLCYGVRVYPERGDEADPFPMDPAVTPYLSLGSIM